jgi:hypothetical protein
MHLTLIRYPVFLRFRKLRWRKWQLDVGWLRNGSVNAKQEWQTIIFFVLHFELLDGLPRHEISTEGGHWLVRCASPNKQSGN